MFNLQAIIDKKSVVCRRSNKSMSTDQLVRLVKEDNVDLKFRDAKGRTFLHQAVKQARVEVIELCLKKGADVNTTDDFGETLLFAAVKSSEAGKILPLLIKHGADVSAKNKNGQNILHCLAWGSLGSDCIDFAADLIKAFVDKGGSLSHRENSLRYQPIHLATAFANNQLVTLFLDHGANVNDAQVKFGKFPLYIAAERKNPVVMETLLKRGANVHLKTSEGRTALHRACEDKSAMFNWENIKLLLDAGADVLVEDNRGNTPLALILRNFHENSVDVDKNNEGIKLMLKALASKKAGMKPSIELKDERIVKKNREMWDYYRACIDNAPKTATVANNTGARKKSHGNKSQGRSYENLQVPWNKPISTNRFTLLQQSN